VISLFTAALGAQTVTFSARQVIDDGLEKAKKNVVVDIDRDGDHDIVCTANPEGSSGTEDATRPNVVLYLNDGTTTFTRTVQTLFDGKLVGGIYRFYWDGKNAQGQDLPSGNYFCLLRAGKVHRSQKLVLVR
jgi:hypothetical protein